MVNEMGRSIHFRTRSQAMIEVQFEGEVGTGNGPTAEFFAMFSKEIQHSRFQLWSSSSGLLSENSSTQSNSFSDG